MGISADRVVTRCRLTRYGARVCVRLLGVALTCSAARHQQYYKDWASVALSHSQAFSDWLTALEEVGGRYGCRVVSAALGKAVAATRDNLEKRLAVVHLFYEATQCLDRCPGNIREFTVSERERVGLGAGGLVAAYRMVGVLLISDVAIRPAWRRRRRTKPSALTMPRNS